MIYCVPGPKTWTGPLGPAYNRRRWYPPKSTTGAKARVLLRRQFMEALDQVDVLVSATAPYPAPNHTDLTATFEDADDVRTRFFFRRSYTGCYALAALPAISLPGGFTSENLPIGLQLGARPFAEETLLRAGHAYEQATPWHQRLAPESQL